MNNTCPRCGKEYSKDNIPRKRTTRYEDCILKCRNCKIGISNNNKTIIYKNYLDNIPKQLYNRLEFILKNNLNIKSHSQKIIRMGFSTSEDSLSWIFFSYFLIYNRQYILLDLFNIDSKKIVNIYFWGSGYFDNLLFVKELKKILKDIFFENEKSFSEPDIIIETENKIIFIEIKYHSKNVSKCDKNKVKKYVKSKYYKDEDKAIKSEYYELIRNWSILNEIGKNKECYLYNIGLRKNFEKETKTDKYNLFLESLIKSENFIRYYWEDIVEKINNKDVDEWFYKVMYKWVS